MAYPGLSLQAVPIADLLAADGVSGGVVRVGLRKLLGETWGPQCVQGLVERLKIVGGHDDGRNPPVPGDLDDLMGGVRLVNQRGKLVFGLC